MCRSKVCDTALESTCSVLSITVSHSFMRRILAESDAKMCTIRLVRHEANRTHFRSALHQHPMDDAVRYGVQKRWLSAFDAPIVPHHPLDTRRMRHPHVSIRQFRTDTYAFRILRVFIGCSSAIRSWKVHVVHFPTPYCSCASKDTRGEKDM